MNVSVKPPAVLKRRKLSSKQWQQPNSSLGQLGENRALNLLISKKYLIQDRNVQTKYGEIDIVAFDPEHHELVFCEVKTRSSSSFGHPSQAVNWKKRLAWRKTAGIYLAMHLTNLDFRFDVITISPQGVFHYQNITF